VSDTESQFFSDAQESEAGPRLGASADNWQQAAAAQPAAPEPEAEAGTPAYQVALLEPLRPSNELLFARMGDDNRSEQIRKLRTQLLLSAHINQGGILTLAIVGAGTGEGRSLLAAELALAFSQLGRPTLLIDADLRKPRQHTLFGIETPGPGLIQAILHSDSPGLHSVEGFPPLAVLTAGDRTAENPNELLSSGQFQRLVATLRFRFSCIIVDTPRFGAYSDAQIVSAVLGNVLCVHRAGTSTFRDTQDMLHDLTSSRARILGSVLNHF
jgi:receptor protein-tyrosine kinase